MYVGNLAKATDAGVVTAVNGKPLTNFSSFGLTYATKRGDRTATFSPTLTGNFFVLMPYPYADSLL